MNPLPGPLSIEAALPAPRSPVRGVLLVPGVPAPSREGATRFPPGGLVRRRFRRRLGLGTLGNRRCSIRWFSPPSATSVNQPPRTLREVSTWRCRKSGRSFPVRIGMPKRDGDPPADVEHGHHCDPQCAVAGTASQQAGISSQGGAEPSASSGERLRQRRPFVRIGYLPGRPHSMTGQAGLPGRSKRFSGPRWVRTPAGGHCQGWHITCPDTLRQGVSGGHSRRGPWRRP